MRLCKFFFCKLVALLRKVCRLFKISIVVRSKIGVKTTYYVSAPISLCVDDSIILDKDELFLGPDYLIDRYTLLDCPLVQSPHYQLMEMLMNGNDIANSDYIIRYERGTLDIRFPGVLSKKLHNSMYYAFKQSHEKIVQRRSEPVLVYEHKGKYYIYDGKHRAALCALMDSEIRCLLMKRPPIDEAFLQKLISVMKKTPAAFCKTLEYYN